VQRVGIGRFRLTRLPLAVVVLCGFGWGQSAAPSDHEIISQLVQQIKELQQHDRELEARLQILEASPRPESAQAQIASSAENPPAPEAQPATPPTAAPPTSSDMHILGGIQWRGFAEVDYKVLDQRAPETSSYGFVPGSAGNFYTGDFDLFLSSRLSDKTSVLSEIDFEEHDAQKFTVDLRRMLLKYEVDDHLRLAFGRYQISDGYYNWAFRSASWLQTTADRPLVMEFANEGGLLPTQAVGVSVTGSIRAGKLGLNYIAEYGSSDTVRPDISGTGLLNDENNGNHINVGLFLRPDSVAGLQIGGSIYHDRISYITSPAIPGAPITIVPVYPSSARFNQTIVNGHVVYTSKGIEFLSEGFLIRHALIGSNSVFNTPAFYSQMSKKIGPFRPFFRYQYVNASENNAIYDDVGLRFGPSFGARYDVTDSIAFKAQLDRTSRRGLPDLNGLHLQLSGAF
jgi:hypothetical protein